MEKEILDELLKRRGNKRYNFRVSNAFMEDWKVQNGETANASGVSF
jgi:hypothetical protein